MSIYYPKTLLMLTVQKIEFKKLRADAIVPTKGSEFAAGYDLYTIEPVVILPQTRVLVKLGFSTKIPENLYGHISDRSGLAWKKGLHCLGKIIDSDYLGEWGVILYNTNLTETVSLAAGDRIAQVIFHQYYNVNFKEVNELSETQRGEGGFGSTGK